MWISAVFRADFRDDLTIYENQFAAYVSANYFGRDFRAVCESSGTLEGARRDKRFMESFWGREERIVNTNWQPKH